MERGMKETMKGTHERNARFRKERGTSRTDLLVVTVPAKVAAIVDLPSKPHPAQETQ